LVLTGVGETQFKQGESLTQALGDDIEQQGGFTIGKAWQVYEVDAGRMTTQPLRHKENLSGADGRNTPLHMTDGHVAAAEGFSDVGLLEPSPLSQDSDSGADRLIYFSLTYS